MSKGRGGREREELPRPRIGRGEQLDILQERTGLAVDKGEVCGDGGGDWTG